MEPLWHLQSQISPAMVASKQTWRVKKDGKRATTQRKSCDTCHKSKTRCDRQRPICSTCSIFARTCTYMQRDQCGAVESPKSDQSSTTRSSATAKLRRSNSEESTRKVQSPASFASDLMSSARHSLLPPLSISNTNFSVPKSLFNINIDDVYNSADELLPTASLEPAHACTWCLDATCHQFQQLRSPSTNDISFTASGYSDHASRPLAQGLIEAMAMQSDGESSAILAAIRMGIPWATIHDALLSPEYPSGGLARILQPRQMSSLSESHTRSDSLQVIAWDQRQGEQSRGVIGTTSTAKRKPRAAEPALFQEPGTTSEAERPTLLPTWAILPTRMRSLIADPFELAFDTMQAEVGVTTDMETYCGSHAYLSALLRPKHLHDAPRLSQIIASLLTTLRPESVPSVTSLGMMWLYWCIFSWMLSPTEKNFERIPKFMRPTPWQICQPHILVYNFIGGPALRDYLCKNPPPTTAWVAEAVRTIACTWPKTALHALCRHSVTNSIDLHRDCKAHASQAQNWSLGPSVRPHLPNVDEYVTIQTSASYATSLRGAGPGE